MGAGGYSPLTGDIGCYSIKLHTLGAAVFGDKWPYAIYQLVLAVHRLLRANSVTICAMFFLHVYTEKAVVFGVRLTVLLRPKNGSLHVLSWRQT
jgi:hypothetical protein